MFTRSINLDDSFTCTAPRSAATMTRLGKLNQLFAGCKPAEYGWIYREAGEWHPATYETTFYTADTAVACGYISTCISLHEDTISVHLTPHTDWNIDDSGGTTPEEDAKYWRIRASAFAMADVVSRQLAGGNFSITIIKENSRVLTDAGFTHNWMWGMGAWIAPDGSYIQDGYAVITPRMRERVRRATRRASMR